MDKSKKNVPEIRFPGFTAPWEQRKLSDVADIIGGGTPSTDVPEYWDGDIDWYAPAEINDQIYVDHSERKITQLGLEKSSAKILTAHKTVLFTSRAGIGKTAILQHDAATNQGFQSLVLNDDINPYFIFTMTEMIKSKAEKVASGSTFAEISGKMLGKLEFMFPTFEEQARIGDCFEHIDSIITLHQRKCDELKIYKKGLLQQLFPQPGEAFPRVRFPGFTDPWEQRKLFACIEKITDFRGRTPKKLGMDWSESGYLALSALNVKDGYIDFNQDVHYGNQELYDKWMSGNELHKGQVLFTTEAPMGNVAQVPDNKRYILSQRTIAFDVDENVITESFLATVLRTPGVQSDLSSLSSGGTAKGVSQKTLNEVYIMIPNNTEEQESIASIFLGVDHLITLHQRKCDELKLYKKGLLQKMFV